MEEEEVTQAPSQKPPETGIAAQLRAQRERNQKLQKIKANLAPEKPAAEKPMKQRITEIVQSNLSPKEKEEQLKALKVSPGTLPVTKIPPAPKFRSDPADPADFPKVPDESPLTSYFGEQEQAKTETMQAEAEEQLIYEQGGPQQTQFIKGAKVTGGVNPQTGVAVDPFQDPVNTPAAKAVLAMQNDYRRETGRELYITSGQRTIEENMAQHPGVSRERAATGQHVHGKAYDFYMAPPADGPFVMHKGKKHLSGHKLTDEWKWLDANASKYGFVNTAPTDRKTGRKEGWHWEFTGPGGAAELPSKAEVAKVEAAVTSGGIPDENWVMAKDQPKFSVPGKKAVGTVEDRIPSDDIHVALKEIGRELGESRFRADQSEDYLDIKDRNDEIATALKNSLGKQYTDTLALQAKQNETTRLIAKNKADLAEKEIAVLQAEDTVDRKAADLRRQWNDEALDQGYARIQEVNKEIEAIKAKEISPWSMFGAYVVNEETGEEEWSWGKASFTFISSMALLANFVATIGSTMSKKGKQIPFLVYDMLNDAIMADTKAQVASIDRDFEMMDKKEAGYKDIMNVVKDQRAFVEQSRLDKIGGIRSGLRIEKAKTKSAEMKTVLEELDAKFALAATKARVARDSAILDIEGKQAATAITALSAHDRKEQRLVDLYINGIAQVAKLKAKERKLTKTQENKVEVAQNMLVMARDIETLWDRSGDSWLTKTAHWASSAIGATKALQFIKGEGNWEELDDLEKLSVIRETWAPMLAKSMGDAGNLAEQEQKRAMNQLPMYDTSEIGKWKVLRFKQRIMLASSREYQLLDDDQKRYLRGQVLAQPDTLKGLKEQARIQKQFLDQLGKQEMMKVMQPSDTERDMALRQRYSQEKPVGSPEVGNIKAPPPKTESKTERTQGIPLDFSR